MSDNFRVGDEFRRNPLSKIPGGSTVVLTDRTGKSRTYDKIKNMGAYVKKALTNPEIAFAMVGNEKIYKDQVNW